MISFRCSGRAVGVATLFVTAFVPTQSQAHHYLQAPPAMYEQNSTGDPQKVGPCGDDGTATPTGEVTTYQAGDTVTIMIDETIFHPGHYRIAIGTNDPSELPPEPVVTPTMDDDCASTVIDPAPVFPVLVDGALVHTDPFVGTQTIEVTLPGDLSCTACTLQVLQYMSSHGAPCFYHHCATIAVEGSSGETSSTTGDPPGSTSTDPETSASDTAESSTTDPESETTNNASASGNGESDGSGTTPVTTTAPVEEPEDSGCGCSHRDGGAPLGLIVGLLGIAGLRSRRRRAVG